MLFLANHKALVRVVAWDKLPGKSPGANQASFVDIVSGCPKFQKELEG